MQKLFRIKICGITRPQDARLVAEAGADAIGLNFYPPSLRNLSEEQAEEIVRRAPSNLVKVGVFADADAGRVNRLFDTLRLDFIQLHGDEPPEYLQDLGGRPVVKAFRLRVGEVQSVRDYLDKCQSLEVMPRAVLIDAHSTKGLGGTGEKTDWLQLAPPREWLLDLPLVLAGGLKPANIGDAVRLVQPDAVDVASGVETEPGTKSPKRVAQFIAAALGAYEKGAEK